ncbi:MAG: HAD-IC family P-type ATPase, partial [Oscillospiraceae bacterium]|nr:HAD-IC family P-type ATPase [Oscillospiraceae bacterium]
MKTTTSEHLNRVLPRIEAPVSQGLTENQAKERQENGYANVTPGTAGKSIGQIIVSNVCTYFNLVFAVLALLLVLVGSYNDLMFVPIIIINTLIGIVQEIRSKSMTDKLNLMTAPKAYVVRDGQTVTIPVEAVVRDDIASFRAGSQIYADATVLEGECRVNESMVTGEADEIIKAPGDTLLSGSFVISGSCYARMERVGPDSFAARLTNEAKKSKKQKQSEMLRALNRLLTIIGILIIPMGILMYLQQTRVLGFAVKESVVSTIGALIGMIPEGLFLLVSVALVVSVMRLAKRKTLVHEMGCIESLARVDVLCVDKTGTITENKMSVEGLVVLQPGRWDEESVRRLMNDYVGCMTKDNDTMQALSEYFTEGTGRPAQQVMGFSSAVKYGGVSFEGGETYVLGAPELIMRSDFSAIEEQVNQYSATGCRVLLLARYHGVLEGKPLTEPAEPIGLMLLANRIREEAPGTFEFFQKQGVTILVISGDNPVTVSSVALSAGIRGAERYVDASTLTTERKIQRAVQDYVVFGRVTPEKKRKLIRALKKQGHTVAMTGDGVNDILAMKEADCSVAMASGSEVASQVAQIVLMDSKFSSMPSVVMEGRRVINNIERSASLFLVKNIFSFMLALAALALTLGYPLSPSQLTLVNMT